MPSIEKLTERFFQTPEWFPKSLLGGLLSFIPLLNIFAFGYLYKYTKQIHDEGSIELPEWGDWWSLFKDGLCFLLIWVIFFGGPILLGQLLSECINLLTFNSLGLISDFPLALGLLVAPAFFMAALLRFQRDDKNWSTLWKIKPMLFPLSLYWKTALPFTFFLMGVFLIGLPIFGLSFFIGSCLMSCYFTTLLRRTL